MSNELDLFAEVTVVRALKVMNESLKSESWHFADGKLCWKNSTGMYPVVSINKDNYELVIATLQTVIGRAVIEDRGMADYRYISLKAILADVEGIMTSEEIGKTSDSISIINSSND